MTRVSFSLAPIIIGLAAVTHSSLRATDLTDPSTALGVFNVNTKLNVPGVGGLSVTGNGGAVFTGTLNSGVLVGVIGPGARMVWNPNKAAFRSGYAAGSEWNDTSLGQYSFAAGYNATASTASAIALGSNVSSTGGSGSLATGNITFATGPSSLAAGLYSTASGSYSIALGYGVQATKMAATALGNNTLAGGDYAVSMGQNTTANAFGSLVIGRFNHIEGTPGSWVSTEPLFVIGNGTSSAARQNAFTVYKNGDIKIAKPQGDISMGEFGD